MMRFDAATFIELRCCRRFRYATIALMMLLAATCQKRHAMVRADAAIIGLRC